MAKTIVVCGHGPGISDAVARRFGREGFQVALVARSADRLAAAAKTLADAGVSAKGFPCDLGDAAAVKAMIREVSASFGPIAAIHYNAYGGGMGDLLSLDAAAIRTSVDVSAGGLLAAVQEALPSLRESKGVVLVTGGGFAFYDANVDGMANAFGAGALAIGKAAQHKAVGLLHDRLGKEGVYVGEVVVLGMVKGTAFDSGNATLDANDIAEKFWELSQRREPRSVHFG